MFNRFSAICILVALISSPLAKAETYTTIADGDWNSASTWQGGNIPGANLTGHTVNISRRVTYPSSLGDLSIGNGILNVSKILILNDVNLVMGNSDGRVNINGGLVILTNKNFDNSQGRVDMNDGAVQLCNGNYTVRNSAETRGNDGYVFSKNGNIERFDPGEFDNDIKWCNDVGVGTGLAAENCGVARPPAGDCLNESHYLGLNSSIQKWDTAINIYKIFAGKLDYTVIGNSELRETGGTNNCKNGEDSSATLSLPTGAKVVAAYLYWYAMEKNIEDGFAYVPISDSVPVTFVSTALTINASRSASSAVQPSSSRQFIHASRFADVTTLMSTNPNGSYTVDVKGGATDSACPLRQENARGWSLVVVYQNPAATGADRIYIYDGFVGFLGSNISVPVTGYKIPALRPGGNMTTVSLQGDAGLSGEFLDTSDTTFPNYPGDFANSSSGAALDIDFLSGNFIANSTNMSLSAGSTGDLIYLTNIIVKAPSEMDFSDGPVTYGDAIHALPLGAPSLYLGTAPPDDDINSQPSDAANWDDTNGSDDEGTITPPGEWRKGQTETLDIPVNGTGFLNIWIDWNQDGDFDDADEHIVNSQSVSTGTVNISVPVPVTATGGDHVVRARLCSVAAECNTPSGFANDGEVEDYLIPVATCIGLTGEVSEVPPAIPPLIEPGISQKFIASRSQDPDPAEGHLRAYLYNINGEVSTTASWDAATEMDAAERENSLYSTDDSGGLVLFNSLDDAAFSVVSPDVATIKNYTLNPSFGGGIYLNGRRSGSFLGPISRGNSLTLVTRAQNTTRFLNDPAYRAFFNGTVTTRSEKALVTSDDGFLYAFNQSDGELSWGWMPRSLVEELKNNNTFLSSLYMRGRLDVLDIKDGAGNYATYAVGAYKNGLGHYVLKLSNTAGLDSVIWDEDRSASFNASANRGEMGYFTDGSGNTYMAYVLTTGSNLSTLVIKNVVTSAATEVPLNFYATSTPFIIPDFDDAVGPASKALYLGDSNGNIRRAALLANNGTLNNVTTLQTALQSTSFVGDLGVSEPILFLGAAASSFNRNYYLRAQSENRFTMLVYDAIASSTTHTKWLKKWTSYVGGAGTWDPTGTTFTPDTSGPPTDLNGDDILDITINGIQSLPANAKITDAAQIVGDSVLLPLSVPITGQCSGNAYLNLYQVNNGIFPGNKFGTITGIKNGVFFATNIHLGKGDATRATSSDLPGQETIKIVSGSDQVSDPNKGELHMLDNVSTGLRGWKEIGRD